MASPNTSVIHTSSTPVTVTCPGCGTLIPAGSEVLMDQTGRTLCGSLGCPTSRSTRRVAYHMPPTEPARPYLVGVGWPKP